MSEYIKNHPLAIICGVIVTTIITFMTVVAPILEKTNINKIQELDATLEKIKTKNTKAINLLKTQVNQLSAANEDLRQRAASLESLAAQYKNEDRFLSSHPYPKGLRKIKIFSPYSIVGEVSPDKNFNENTLFTVIEISDEMFSNIIFYSFFCNESKIIKEIRYIYRTPLDSYIELKKKHDATAINLSRPTDDEISLSTNAIKDALIEIMKEKFQSGYTTKENEYIAKSPDNTVVLVADKFMSISSAFSDEELIKTCQMLK